MSCTTPGQRTRAPGSRRTIHISSTHHGSVDPISSIPLHSIPTFGSTLSLKSPDNVRFYLEKVNGLPISYPTWRLSHKYKRLRQIMHRLEIDSVAIAETQINPSLLLNSNVVHDNLFRAEHHVDVMANNSNELLGRRQQEGVMLSVHNDLSKYSSTVEIDSTGLGRWVYLDITSPQKKPRIICAC